MPNDWGLSDGYQPSASLAAAEQQQHGDNGPTKKTRRRHGQSPLPAMDHREASSRPVKSRFLFQGYFIANKIYTAPCLIYLTRTRASCSCWNTMKGSRLQSNLANQSLLLLSTVTHPSMCWVSAEFPLMTLSPAGHQFSTCRRPSRRCPSRRLQSTWSETEKPQPSNNHRAQFVLEIQAHPTHFRFRVTNCSSYSGRFSFLADVFQLLLKVSNVKHNIRQVNWKFIPIVCRSTPTEASQLVRRISENKSSVDYFFPSSSQTDSHVSYNSIRTPPRQLVWEELRFH